MNCKYCGSKYLTTLSSSADLNGTTYKFSCECCKKTYEETIAKREAPGTWLMTIRNSDGTVAEFFRNGSDEIEVNYRQGYTKWEYDKITPKIRIDICTDNVWLLGYLSLYCDFGTVNIFAKPFPSIVGRMTIGEIEMNSELTEVALGNEAMRCFHKNGNVFQIISQKNYDLFMDARVWINKTVFRCPPPFI